jgi:hypothetical protein
MCEFLGKQQRRETFDAPCSRRIARARALAELLGDAHMRVNEVLTGELRANGRLRGLGKAGRAPILSGCFCFGERQSAMLTNIGRAAHRVPNLGH